MDSDHRFFLFVWCFCTNTVEMDSLMTKNKTKRGNHSWLKQITWHKPGSTKMPNTFTSSSYFISMFFRFVFRRVFSRLFSFWISWKFCKYQFYVIFLFDHMYSNIVAFILFWIQFKEFSSSKSIDKTTNL